MEFNGQQLTLSASIYHGSGATALTLIENDTKTTYAKLTINLPGWSIGFDDRYHVVPNVYDIGSDLLDTVLRTGLVSLEPDQLVYQGPNVLEVWRVACPNLRQQIDDLRSQWDESKRSAAL